MEKIALAFAAIEVPVLVCVASTLNANALTSEGVELLELVIALAHFITAWAVFIVVQCSTPHELAVGAGDQRLIHA